jgi:hypothetical protein
LNSATLLWGSFPIAGFLGLSDARRECCACAGVCIVRFDVKRCGRLESRLRDVLVEAELDEGVISSPLSKYRQAHSRICRPVGLASEDIEAVVSFAVERIGFTYDLKNIFDLVRYLLPTPPVVVAWQLDSQHSDVQWMSEDEINSATNVHPNTKAYF